MIWISVLILGTLRGMSYRELIVRPFTQRKSLDIRGPSGIQYSTNTVHKMSRPCYTSVPRSSYP